MNLPFFSICIAAYDAQRYIDECLGSISAQDCHDYEVIIVDDGSLQPLVLDKTICTLLPSCKLIRTDNGGPYAARQTAFEAAGGEAVLCVDADDGLCDPSALSKVKRAFEAGADIVLFNATSSEHNPSLMFDFSTLGEDGPVEEDLVWDLYTKGYLLNSLCCKAFRRTLYSKGDKKRPRLLMAEDRLQSLEIMGCARSYWLIDEPLYFYRPNPASTTNAGYNPDYFAQACYVEEEVVAFMEGRGMPLGGWARYFLSYTSSALLGMRYNRSLNFKARRSSYASARSEHIVELASEHCGVGLLPKVDALRLRLLLDNRYAALDASMLPWRIGSGIKRLVRRGSKR